MNFLGLFKGIHDPEPEGEAPAEKKSAPDGMPHCFGHADEYKECAECEHLGQCQYAKARAEKKDAVAKLRTSTKKIRAVAISDEGEPAVS